MSRKHWSKTNTWKMSEHLHGCILDALEVLIQATKFISIIDDEVTTIECTILLGLVLMYMLWNLKRESSICFIYFVSKDNTLDHLTQVIMNALMVED